MNRTSRHVCDRARPARSGAANSCWFVPSSARRRRPKWFRSRSNPESIAEQRGLRDSHRMRIRSRYSTAARISSASHSVQSSLSGNPDTPVLRPTATILTARRCEPWSWHKARNRCVKATEGSAFISGQSRQGRARTAFRMRANSVRSACTWRDTSPVYRVVSVPCEEKRRSRSRRGPNGPRPQTLTADRHRNARDRPAATDPFLGHRTARCPAAARSQRLTTRVDCVTARSFYDPPPTTTTPVPAREARCARSNSIDARW